MALTRKPSPPQRAKALGDLPQDVPRVPAEFVRKFKELDGYQAELEVFWYKVRTVLLRDREETDAVIAEALNEIAELKAQAVTP